MQSKGVKGDTIYWASNIGQVLCTLLTDSLKRNNTLQEVKEEVKTKLEQKVQSGMRWNMHTLKVQILSRWALNLARSFPG